LKRSTFKAKVALEAIRGKALSIFCAIFCMLFVIENIRMRRGKELRLLSGYFFYCSATGLMMYTSLEPHTFGLKFIADGPHNYDPNEEKANPVEAR
jgi:hypothetical protein